MNLFMARIIIIGSSSQAICIIEKNYVNFNNTGREVERSGREQRKRDEHATVYKLHLTARNARAQKSITRKKQRTSCRAHSVGFYS